MTLPAVGPPDIEETAESDSTIDEKPTYDNHDAHNCQSNDKEDIDLDHRPVPNVLSRVASRLSATSTLEPPPDGGKAWIQCLMAWLVVFNTWGYVLSYGSFQAYYVSTLNLSQSTISWIGSVQACVLFLVGAFSGRALDAGLFMPTFVVGAVLQLVGIFTTSVSTTFWQLMLSEGLCTGIGSGIFFCPVMALLATYFSKRRGIAVALATTGNSAGGMVYPVLVTHLLPQIGFGWTVRILGFLNMACLSLVLVFMRPRLPPRKSGPLIEFAAFKEPAYALFVTALFFAIWSLYFTSYFIVSYGRDVLGLSYSHSVTLLIVLNGIGIPARIVAGHVADQYFGPLNTFIPIVLANAILAYCWLAVSDVGSLYAFACFYGLINAAWQSLLPTTIASLTPDLRKTGTRLGMAFSVISLASLTGPPIGGAMIGLDGRGYLAPQLWAATAMLLASLLLAAARVTKYGFGIHVKG